ncbi:MAG: enoyl-CoA hydratase [Firmicutes bacterium]|nr:enoyl-CoA hydratase [Bacillota bacterium]
MSGNFVRWSQEKNIAVVVVDNPPLNLLSSNVAVELLQCLQEINKTDGCRAMVLAGKGKVFMAGADIKELAGLVSFSRSTLPFTGVLHKTLNYLENLPIPTIAALNGPALGGGLELALTFDLRFASETALLGVPEITLGLFPGAGGTQRLPRLIGIPAAKEMLFTGKPVTAAEALRLGLVNKVVPQNEIFTVSKEMAHFLTSRPGKALRLLKEAVNRGMETSCAEGCRIERDLLDRAFKTADAREGINAFLKKRKAQFKHY